jgi:deoxyribonuclease-1
VLNNKLKTVTLVLTVALSLFLIECRDSSSDSVVAPAPPQADTLPDLDEKPESPTAPNANAEKPVVDYYHSKYAMLENIYDRPELRVTFYCQCKFTAERTIEADGCNFPIDKNRMLWEHVVPAYVFGKDLPEWKNWREYCTGRRSKGRKCARKHSKLFNQMEGDMYNLHPSVDYLNNRRGHLSFGEFTDLTGVNELCGYSLANHIVEPRDGIRGDIARTYLYMDSRYPQVNIIKSDDERKLYTDWSLIDPVDAWECERACMIEKLQGNDNKFLKPECLNQGLYSCK